MTDDPAERMIQVCMAEGTLRALLHLVRRYSFTDAEEQRIIEDLKPNTGRPAGEYTLADWEHKAAFLREVKAKKVGKGPAATSRAVDLVFPKYETLPSGRPFVKSSALYIALRGLPKKPKPRNIDK